MFGTRSAEFQTDDVALPRCKRSFPRYLVPLFQASLSAKPFIWKWVVHAVSFSCNNQSHFHMKSFALRLALKQRHKGTRKWPISCCSVLNFRARVACMAGSQRERRRKNFARLVFALQAWSLHSQTGRCVFRCWTPSRNMENISIAFHASQVGERKKLSRKNTF